MMVAKSYAIKLSVLYRYRFEFNSNEIAFYVIIDLIFNVKFKSIRIINFFFFSTLSVYMK